MANYKLKVSKVAANLRLDEQKSHQTQAEAKAAEQYDESILFAPISYMYEYLYYHPLLARLVLSKDS